MMRCLLATFALLVAVPVVAYADPIVSTYVFEGCIQNRSCHRAEVVVTNHNLTTGTNFFSYDVSIFSTFLEPGMIRVLIWPGFPPNYTDPEFLAKFCTGSVGERRDDFFTGAPLEFFPTNLLLGLAYGPGSLCGGQEATDVAILTLTPSDPTVVPEPGTIALLAPGLAGLAFARRRMKVRLKG